MSTNTANSITPANRVKALFERLGLQDELSGTCYGVAKWSACSDRRRIDTINPADGQVLASVHASNAADYEQVLIASQHRYRYWKNIPAPKRGELVRQVGELLREYKDALGSLVSLEMGKIKQEGDGEVQEMIDIADFAVGQSRMLYGRTMHSERAEHRMYEQWHPLGPVAVISAFNFPVAVWAWNAFIAAICGNTVIWKPSPKTPLCAIAVQHLCNRAMQQCDADGVFTLMIPDSSDDGTELATRLVDDVRVPLVSFTGSTAVGREVGTRVSQRMGRSLLELSGNNALIVDATADLDLAVPSIVFGFAGTAGQRCTTTRRLFVHESRREELMKRLKNAVSQLKVGNPLDEQVLMGPLIDEQAVRAFENTMVEILQLGGEVVCGGERIPSAGCFVEPTIVYAKNDWSVVQRETFAPILYVMTFSELDEAITMQNNVNQGLSSSIFTESLRNAEQFLSAQGSDCGIANVNIGTSGAEIGGAFGGEKETGGGREAGSDSWKAYMRRQTNTINWSSELPLAQGIKFNLD